MTGLSTWESYEKCYLDVFLVACHKKQYKGESVGFLQIQVMVSFMNMCMLVHYLCIKNVPIMH